MESNNDIYDASAEFLLNYLYPEKIDKWIADCKGSFKRNYSRDVLSIDLDEQRVKMSRDGFFRLLPHGLYATDFNAKGEDFKEKYEALQKKKALFHDLFGPVDTVIFHDRLHLEREISQLLKNELPYILKTYFSYDLEAETCPLIKKIAPLLLYIKNYRADFGLIKNLLSKLLNCRVEMIIGQYKWGETNKQAQPEVRFNAQIPHLNAEQYKELSKQIEPLNDFICEWFIPFDTHCVISIKQHEKTFTLDSGLVLDYNTEVIL